MFCSLVLLCFSGRLLPGQINHQVSFSSEILLSEEHLDDGEIYTRVKIPGTVRMDSVGFPSLPVKYIKLIVPFDAFDFTLAIDSIDKQMYKLKYKVEPLQEPVPIGNHDTPWFVSPDKNRYNSNVSYPTQIIRIIETGLFKGNYLVTIAVFPCQYHPKKNELEYYEKICFTLNFKKEGVEIKYNSERERNDISNYRKILEYVIDNPSDIDRFSTFRYSSELDSFSYQMNSPNLKSTCTSGIAIDCDYVIVTSQNLAPSFNEFMAWKRRKGIDIELVTMEEISANYTGDNISGINDEAGKLRQFLSDAYDSGSGINYALLGGDNTLVPIRYWYHNNTTIDDSYIIPTDLYFADFDGDWEVDGDSRYGEPYVSSTGDGDDVNFEPEIFIGRVMVTTQDEIKNWTKKVLMYEENPGNGDYDYLTKAFFTQADQLQRDDAARYILNRSTWISDTVVFEEQGGGCTSFVPNFPDGNSTIDEFNNEYGFCSFMGHGGPTNVAVATLYYNSDKKCDGSSYTGSTANTKRKITSFDDGSGGCCMIVETANGFDNMTNENHPTIYYSVSCETTPFDDYETPIDDRNMGETYTCISIGGGSHYIGNTRYGYVYGSRMLFAEFVDIISSGTSYNLGIAEATSKLNYNHRYLRFSHNLIGCPETEIWTATPSMFSNASVSESGSNVTVSTGGISNSRICVMSALDNGGSYYAVKQNVSSWTFTSVPKPYNVTITKHNYIPFLKNPDNVYIQNESIYSDKYIYGTNIYAGEDVTDSTPEGPAIIKSGVHVAFDATNEVSLEAGFEVEVGGEFEAK